MLHNTLHTVSISAAQ